MMAGRPPKVDHIREQFLSAIDSATKLYTQVQKVSTIRASPTHPRLHAEHVRRVVELAFMGIVASWEDFVEGTMVRYVAGAKTSSDYAPTLRLGAAKSLEHAYQLVTGDPDHDPAKHYVSWNDPVATCKLARVVFEAGRPYVGQLDNNNVSQLLKDATKLRNRVAHASVKCREDFKSVARRFKGLPNGAKLTQGYRVGDLLTEKAERHFGDRAKNKGSTFFEAYCDLYQKLAKKIVP